MASTTKPRARDSDLGKSHVVEAKVTLAVDGFRSGEYKTIKAAASAFGAPYHRTRSRINGHPSRQSNGGNNVVLTKAMETALHSSLQRLVAQGTRITTNLLWSTANDILRLACDDGSEPRQVRLRWARRYLARNRHIFKIYEGLSSEAVRSSEAARSSEVARSEEAAHSLEAACSPAAARSPEASQSSEAARSPSPAGPAQDS